jgi:hypothetical protein
MFKRLSLVLALLLISAPAAFAQTNLSATAPMQATITTEKAAGVAGKPFVLDGSRSSDDGTIRTFSWTQVSGPHTFKLATGGKITVVPPSAGTYVFELVATDRAGNSETVQKISLIVTAQTTSATAGGTADINIGIGEMKKEEKEEEEKPKSSGNVEYEWKVEEGESAPAQGIDEVKTQDGPQPVTPDFSILLGGGGSEATGGVSVAAGDVNGDGLTDAKRAEIAEVLKQGMQEAGVPVESLSINFEKIQTTVKHKVHLFGFIPVMAQADIEIDAKSEVQVKFPWWSFLASGADGKVLGVEVMTQLSNVLKTKHDTVKNSIGNIR